MTYQVVVSDAASNAIQEFRYELLFTLFKNF